MSYIKQTWTTGDTITAEKLNHIEDGVANTNSMLIDMTFDSETRLLKSNVLFSDIVSAFINGVEIVVHIPEVTDYSVAEAYLRLRAYIPESTYRVFTYDTEASSLLNKLYENEQGYFCGEVYID